MKNFNQSFFCMVKTVKTIKILKLKIGQDPKVKDWIKNWTNLKNRIGNWTKSRKLKTGLKIGQNQKITKIENSKSS